MQWFAPPPPPLFICKTLKSVGRYPLIRKMIYGHAMQCDAMWNPDSRMTWTLPRTCIESYPGGRGGVSPTLWVRNWGLSEPCRILGISRKKTDPSHLVTRNGQVKSDLYSGGYQFTVVNVRNRCGGDSSGQPRSKTANFLGSGESQLTCVVHPPFKNPFCWFLSDLSLIIGYPCH